MIGRIVKSVIQKIRFELCKPELANSGAFMCILFLMSAFTIVSKAETLHQSSDFTGSMDGYILETEEFNSLNLTTGPRFEIKFIKDQPKSLEELGKPSFRGVVYFDGVKMCDSYVRATYLEHSGKMVLLGNIQDLDSLYGDFNVSKNEEWAIDDLKEGLVTRFSNDTAFSFKDVSSCYLIKDGFISEAIRYTYSTSLGHFRAQIVDNEVMTIPVDLHPSFAVSGSMSVYENRVTDTAGPVTKSFSDFTSSGKLESTYVVMSNSPVESDYIFDYSESSDDFARTSLFYWAEKHLSYLRSIGFIDYANGPIEIEFPNNTTGDNAAYMPASTSSSRPFISIGRGVSALQNLGLDEDVVSHEIGHHVVFEYLTDFAGNSETIVLHEAIADFFVFNRTGDGCLGDSICPLNSTACYEVNNGSGQSCLRKTGVSFKYNDSEYNSVTLHMKSQVVSSMLADIESSIGSAKVSKLVLKSLTYLPSNANIEVFILGLFYSDLDNFSGAYRSAIKSAATKYGFSSYLTNIPDSGSNLPDIGSVKVDQDSGSVVVQKSSSDDGGGGWFGCSIGQTGHRHGANGYLLMLLLPVFFLRFTAPIMSKK